MISIATRPTSNAFWSIGRKLLSLLISPAYLLFWFCTVNMSTITMLLDLLCSSSCLAKSYSLCLSPEPQATSAHPSKRVKFTFKERSLWRSRTVTDCKGEIRVSISGQTQEDLVAYKNIYFAPVFDTRDDDIFRNIRRCSLAPLGDSYLVKQFELDSRSGKHFNHVIKIEPREIHEGLIPQPPSNIADFLQINLTGKKVV